MTISEQIKSIDNVTKLGIGGGAIIGATLEQRKEIQRWEDKCFEAKLRGEPLPPPPDSIMPLLVGAVKGGFVGGVGAAGANYISKTVKPQSEEAKLAIKSIGLAPLAAGLLKDGMSNKTEREKLRMQTLSDIEKERIKKEKEEKLKDLQREEDFVKGQLQERQKILKNKMKDKIQQYKLEKYKAKLRYKLAKKGIKMDFSYLVDDWVDVFITNFNTPPSKKLKLKFNEINWLSIITNIYKPETSSKLGISPAGLALSAVSIGAMALGSPIGVFGGLQRREKEADYRYIKNHLGNSGIIQRLNAFFKKNFTTTEVIKLQNKYKSKYSKWLKKYEAYKPFFVTSFKNDVVRANNSKEEANKLKDEFESIIAPMQREARDLLLASGWLKE